MNKIKRAKFAALFFGLVAAFLALAQENNELAETATETPAPPSLPSAPPNYFSFFSSAQLDFAIDLNSIGVQSGAEHEIRYTLKATSKRGAVNISYEGIRCDNHQKIIYAIGDKDAGWHRVRSPEWKAIYSTGVNTQHNDLEKYYFCVGTTLSGDAQSIRDRLKLKRPLSD